MDLRWHVSGHDTRAKLTNYVTCLTHGLTICLQTSDDLSKAIAVDNTNNRESTLIDAVVPEEEDTIQLETDMVIPEESTKPTGWRLHNKSAVPAATLLQTGGCSDCRCSAPEFKPGQCFGQCLGSLVPTMSCHGVCCKLTWKMVENIAKSWAERVWSWIKDLIHQIQDFAADFMNTVKDAMLIPHSHADLTLNVKRQCTWQCTCNAMQTYSPTFSAPSPVNLAASTCPISYKFLTPTLKF